jgi:hypothetical protein
VTTKPRRLLEHQFGAHPRRADLKPALGLRRVIDPRAPTLLSQRPVCLGDQDRGSSASRTQWTSAASSHQSGSRAITQRCAPERINERMARLVAPYCMDPEGAMGISKDRNRQVPSRTLGLSCRAKGLDQEPRHVSPKPNPEPCDGHKGHKLNDASAELDHLARREQGRGARRGCLSSVSVAAPAVVAGVPSARTSGERAGRLNADRQGTAALLESAVTRLSGATVSSSVGSNCIAARGNRALTLNALLTVVFQPLRNRHFRPRFRPLRPSPGSSRAGRPRAGDGGT